MTRLRRLLKRTRIIPAARWLLRRLPLILVLSLLVILLIQIMHLLYALPGSGFGSFVDAQRRVVPARTLWDWLATFAGPAVLLLIGLVVARLLRRAVHVQAYLTQLREEAQAQEASLQTYFTQINGLLLSGKLDDPETVQNARLVAQSWLALHMSRLNVDQRSRLLRYFYETHLLKGETALDLKSFDFSQTALDGAVLANANLAGVYLAGATLNRANLNGASFRQANLTNVQLEQALLNETQFQKAQLIGAWLVSASMTACNLEGANLSHAVLQRAHLLRARLAAASLEAAQLQWANFEEADLDNAYMKRAMLQQANLRNAKLRWAHLQHSHLQGANLTGADFKYANLQGANLTGAQVTPEQLAEAVMDRQTTLPDGSRYKPAARQPAKSTPRSAAF